MNDFPLLFFPKPDKIDTPKRKGQPVPKPICPGYARQEERLSDKFNSILQFSPQAIVPEQTLVFEVIGSIDDFYKAVEKIDEMEFLGEFPIEDIPQSNDFYLENKKKVLIGPGKIKDWNSFLTRLKYDRSQLESYVFELLSDESKNIIDNYESKITKGDKDRIILDLKTKIIGSFYPNFSEKQRKLLLSELLMAGFNILGSIISFPIIIQQQDRIIEKPEFIIGNRSFYNEEIFSEINLDRFLQKILNKGLDNVDEYQVLVFNRLLLEKIFPDVFKELERKELSRTLYLIWTNKQSMQKLLSMWQKYKRGEFQKPTRGYAKWKNLFNQLLDIRKWDTPDRINDSKIMEYWNEELNEKRETIKFEVELWFTNNDEKRTERKGKIQSLLGNENGRLIKEAIIPEIKYHGILAELPNTTVQNIIDSINNDYNDVIELLKCDDIMFFHPVGQTAVYPYEQLEETEEIAELEEQPEIMENEPICALLDGSPTENHLLLANRLIIDDPDNWASAYQASERVHGTGMASLIIHGDLNENAEPIKSRLYVRPIMKPDDDDFRRRRNECIPKDELPIDLVHRAVKRMFEGEAGEPPTAPNVKIINLSIGDMSRPFDITISRWAKLLDWLSYEYRVLFFVSIGNYTKNINLDLEKNEFINLTPEEKNKRFIREIADNLRKRRILSPSESINSLSVGAFHNDFSNFNPRLKQCRDHRIDIFNGDDYFSPFNRFGLGFKGSVKPDVLFPGGKQLFNEPYTDNSHLDFSGITSFKAPGQLAAVPGQSGEINKKAYTRGTSNANAIASRTAILIYENLLQLDNEQNWNDIMTDDKISVILKALIVHSASWPMDIYDLFENLLKSNRNKQFREYFTRFYGYGITQPERILSCDNNRVSIVGADTIKSGQTHIYEIPIPNELSSENRIHKKITMTLAWLTPCNCESQKYRGIRMWFDNKVINNNNNDDEDNSSKKSFPFIEESLKLNKKDVDLITSKRGTVQHIVFEGDRACTFPTDSKMRINVNCKNDAFPDSSEIEVPYSIVVSVEVAGGIDIPIYNLIKEKIYFPVKVKAPE